VVDISVYTVAVVYVINLSCDSCLVAKTRNGTEIKKVKFGHVTEREQRL